MGLPELSHPATVVQGSHQGKPLRLWTAVVASSVLYAAAHPPWSLWPLALVAAAPVSAVLLDGSSRVSSARAAAAGLLFGALATYLLVGHWTWQAASRFFPDAPLVAIALTAAMPIVASAVALYYALAFVLIARLARYGAAAGVIGSAALWAAAELARSSLGYGNPWGSFASALIAADSALSGFRPETPVADLLAVGGAPAVALAASAIGASLGLAWVERRHAVRRGQALAAGAIVAAALVAVGHFGAILAPLRNAASMPQQPLRVALVQAGIGKNQLWESGGAAESLARHVEITRSFETRGADLVVWSENALPFLLDANPDKQAEVRALARERETSLLVGGSRSEKGPHGTTSVFNSAFLFPADGGEPMVYDKRILLPLVEHVPGWAAMFRASPWQGAFAAGLSPGLFTVKGWRVAPLLCLEALYPGESVSRVAEGADLLVNLSNDSWFDDGAGPEQHFQHATLRAAETRRPLVRVATTGISALVREDGLVSWRLPARTTSVALLDVAPPGHDSLFVRGGRVGFSLLVVAIAAAAAVLPSRTGGIDE